MKTAVLILGDLRSLLKREKASLLVILLSLGLSVGVSLSMLSFFSSNASVFRDMKIAKATYRLYFSEASADKAPIEVFDQFFLSKDSPAVRDAYYAVVFSIYSPDASSVTITYGPVDKQTPPPPTPKIISWRAAFPDERLSPLFEARRERTMLEGRWFEEEEVKSGAAVAVVGRDDFPDAKVGDSIKILDSEVRIIGVRQEHNALPYLLMKTLSGKTAGFIPDNVVCVFYKPLSAEQLDGLARAGVTADCMFDIRKSGYFIEIAVMLGISGGIFLLTVLNALTLFKHLISEARYRFMVLKVCGASEMTVFWGLYLAPLLISAVSSLCGILLFRLLLEPLIMERFQYAVLPVWQLAVTFCSVLLLCFLTLLPTVRRMTNAQPAETALWR